MEKRKFEPAAFPFREYLISTIGKDGHFQYYHKCILFGVMLYVIGLIVALLSGTLFLYPVGGATSGYLLDYYIPVVSGVTAFTSLFAIRATRGLDDKLVYTDQCLYDKRACDDDAKVTKRADQGQKMTPDKDTLKRLSEVEEHMKGNPWFEKSSAHKRYYALSIFFGVLGFFVGLSSALSGAGNWIYPQYIISSVFWMAFCFYVGRTVGALLFISLRGIAVTARYCEEHVKFDSSSCLNPDNLNGLKKMGQFSFELDVAAAIPGFAFFASYLKGTPIGSFASIACLAAYTVVLVLVFFLPLRPFHAKMASAKEEAIKQVNRMSRGVYSRISNESELANPQVIGALRDIYLLHERVSEEPVWPLNFGLRVKFAGTVTFPILVSVFSAYLSKLLGM